MAFSALAWGLIAGSAAFLGALIAWFSRPSARVVAAGMAFASGILLSVAAFELLDEAFAHGGFVPVAIGYLIGAILFGAGLFISSTGRAPVTANAPAPRSGRAARSARSSPWRRCSTASRKP